MELNINDFKLLRMKCLDYYDLYISQANDSVAVSTTSTLTRNQKARYGFYFYILEMITGVSDLTDIAEMITDTDFNGSFRNERFADEGIDAVYINEDENRIELFSFKYRENFNEDRQQSKNELIESVKFLNDIQTRNIDHTDGKTKYFLEDICHKFHDDFEPWHIELFFVTNDTKPLDENDANIINFKKSLGLIVKFISLSDIAKSLIVDHEPIKSELVMDNDAMMSYKESKLISDTSYILRISLTDLIRITCDDDSFRKRTDNYDKEKLSNSHIAYDVLSENVRGFILKSEYNKNISETLENDPSKFFMYNNGITIIASDIKVTPFPNGAKSQVTISDLQVLNGGQTLRTIHNYNEKNKSAGLENLQKAEILVRVFKVTDKSLKNKISEFTNSQNAISNRDLKSISSDQIKLEKYLDNFDIRYIRKNGDVGLNKVEYEYTISMDKLGQILYAVKGTPENATNKKRAIFDSDYNRLFKTEELLTERTVLLIKDYFEIKKKYKQITSKKASEQKLFYFLYIKYNTKLNVIDIIKRFEKYMQSYNSLGSYEQSRLLLKSTFKNEIDQEFEISGDADN